MAEDIHASTTTVHLSEVSVSINVGFLRTPIGILMIVELIIGLLAWSLLVSIWWYNFYWEIGFAAFGFIFSWLSTFDGVAVNLETFRRTHSESGKSLFRGKLLTPACSL